MTPDDGDQGDIIGVIKVKDGIFICDEFGAQVSSPILRCFINYILFSY